MNERMARKLFERFKTSMPFAKDDMGVVVSISVIPRGGIPEGYLPPYVKKDIKNSIEEELVEYSQGIVRDKHDHVTVNPCIYEEDLLHYRGDDVWLSSLKDVEWIVCNESAFPFEVDDVYIDSRVDALAKVLLQVFERDHYTPDDVYLGLHIWECSNVINRQLRMVNLQEYLVSAMTEE